MTRSDQVSSVWDLAIRRYEETTGEKLNDPILKRLTTVNGLLEAIESENKKFSDFREKRQSLFIVLKNAMLPIELVGDIAAGGAAMTFPPSSLIFGAVKYFINAANGVSAKFDAIIDMMETLKDFTVRLQVHSQQQLSQNLHSKLADILVNLLEVFAIAHKQVRRGRFLAFGKNVLLGNDEGGEVMEKLRKLVDSERGLVGAETLTGVKVANTTLDRVDYNLDELKRDLNNMSLASQLSHTDSQESREKEYQDHVKTVLRPGTSADDSYSRINRARVPKTGDWIREEPEFKDWINNQKPMVWVSGTPGAGKSFIASNIIEHLREMYPQNVRHPSHISVGYFFFKDDNSKTRSFHQALRDIAFKVAQNDPVYAKHIATCVDSPHDIHTLESLWKKLFIDFFVLDDSLDSGLYIVLDALDESWVEDRREFFELVNDIKPDGKLHILMLGRPQIIEEIESYVENFDIATIHVSESNNSADIIRYIKSSISKSVYLKRAPKDIQAKIVDKLSSEAQGMFIWVDFLLKELLKKRNTSDMKRAVNEAPRGLYEMIHHVLKSISESLKDTPEYADDLNELMAWTTCAEEPLTLGNMEDILKWKSIDGNGWVWLEGSLRRQFASFFLLTREDGLTTSDLQRSTPLEVIYGVDNQLSDNDEGFGDLDNPFDFNSNLATTKVTFNHASIGDFFRNEDQRRVSAAEDGPPVGVVYHEAQVLVVKRYFELIACDECSPKIEIAANLREYACTALFEALKAVNIDKVQVTDKQLIGRYLVRALSSKPSIVEISWNTGYSLFTHENMELILEWFTDEAVRELLSSEERKWIDATIAENNADIFQPIIRYTARGWLVDGWNQRDCCCGINAFLNLRKGRTGGSIASVEQILEAVEWCGFEKNGNWYRRLGMTLSSYSFYDEALEYFGRALENTSSKRWQVQSDIAATYQRKGQFERAIELHKLVVQSAETETQLHDSYMNLGNCYFAIGEEEMGYEMYRKAIRRDKSCIGCAEEIILYLDKRQIYDEVMVFLNNMDEIIPGNNHTYLTRVTMAYMRPYDPYFTAFCAAAYRTGNVDFILSAYTAAVRAAQQERKPVHAANLELCLGILYHGFGHDPERAIRIWERLMNTYRGSKSEGYLTYALETTSVYLATHYLTHSMISGPTSLESRRCSQMLELLAAGKKLHLPDYIATKHDKDSSSAEGGVVTSSPVGMLLGSYYAFCGRQEEAMRCYKAQVKDCLQLLSDDDPGNDFDGLRRLAHLLGRAGDDLWAIGIYYYIYMRYCQTPRGKEIDMEDGKTSQDHIIDDGQEDAVGPRDIQVHSENEIICDACNADLAADWSTMCRYCHDMLLCQTCIAQLKAGTLDVNVCHPTHGHLLIPPRPAVVKKYGYKYEDMLYIENEWMSLGELKNRLRRKWDI